MSDTKREIGIKKLGDRAMLDTLYQNTPGVGEYLPEYKKQQTAIEQDVYNEMSKSPSPSTTPPAAQPAKPAQPAKSAQPSSYKTGGVVGKTGMAMVHKGETIIPAGANGGAGETIPHRVIPPDAGWLVCPKNVGQYTGENKPWRR